MIVQRYEVSLSTVTTRLSGSPTTLNDEQWEEGIGEGLEPEPVSLTSCFDDDQPQPSICQGLEPAPSSPTGHSCKADYALMAAVCAIIVFLWMQ
jgi:hypothetical protein